MIVLVPNIGSTSLKSKLWKIAEDNHCELLGEASLDRINTAGESGFVTRTGNQSKTYSFVNITGIKRGIEHILEWYTGQNIISNITEIQAVGFKCVMGRSNGAHLLTPEILDEMKRYGFLAPAHNLPYLEGINAFKNVMNIPLVGVFEPSFHYSVPDYKRFLGLPWEWHDLGIRKLGFHGASHRYLSAFAFKLLDSSRGRVITVHLGGSSSVCAVKDGRSVDIDQHFSPNSGLLQGTRAGDTDASAVLFAMRELGLSVSETQQALSLGSGLKSMAGLDTEDCKIIEKAALSGNLRAKMTLDLYVDGIRKHIGAFATVLGGVDCIIFSGGTGENSSYIREKCLENMEFMGIIIDRERNMQKVECHFQISDRNKSAVKIFVVPTNEELVVARFTKEVVEKGRDLLPEEMKFEL